MSKTKAGWLVGIFFAAYVVMVPVLVALTDRIPVRRVFMLGTGLQALSHFGFTLFAGEIVPQSGIYTITPPAGGSWDRIARGSLGGKNL